MNKDLKDIREAIEDLDNLRYYDNPIDGHEVFSGRIEKSTMKTIQTELTCAETTSEPIDHDRQCAKMGDDTVAVKREALRDCILRSTRHKRGCTDEKKYLLMDLEYIEEIIKAALTDEGW